jgi:AraC-like DNA-binding protein
MIRTVVPLIGRAALDPVPDLLTRIQSLVEDDFGHTLKFVDAGSVHDVAKFDPLKVSVPFSIEVEGVIEPALVRDWMEVIIRIFPSSLHIVKRADHIPIELKKQAVALSLGHVNGSPVVIHNAVKLAYKHLSDAGFGVPELATELAISKATLERACLKCGFHGAGHLLSQIQMEEAKRMVLETSAPINQIAMTVGYENLPSFDRRFHAAWGCSPGKMRQNAKSVSQNAKLRRNAKK